MRFYLICLTFIMTLNISHAAVEVLKFSSPKQELRYKDLINELRCLVCQNQNLAGSDAGLAKDLRKQVYKMISEGKTDKEILDFMVTRYGDFVLYRPPFKTSTLILWIGPFIIFFIGLYVLVGFIKQRKNVVTDLSNDEKEKLKGLLDNNQGQEK